MPGYDTIMIGVGTVRITPALAGGAREILPQYMEALRAGATSRL